MYNILPMHHTSNEARQHTMGQMSLNIKYSKIELKHKYIKFS